MLPLTPKRVPDAVRVLADDLARVQGRIVECICVRGIGMGLHEKTGSIASRR